MSRPILWDNPVLVKELRSRMRGARAYWLLAGYLSFLALLLFFQYSTWWTGAQRTGGMSGGARIGQEFFFWIAVTQAFLVAFITPAIACGAITLEREQRTLEMLEMTGLSPGTIVAGKLLAAVGFVALLLISSLPLASICFILGGVSPAQVAYTYLLLIAGSFVTGALGVVCSTIARNTSTAIAMTYFALLWPPLGALMMLGSTGATMGGYGGLNGGVVTMGIVLAIYGVTIGEGYSAVSSFLRVWNVRHYYGLTLPAWLPPALTYVLISVLLIALAASRLETIPDRKTGLLRALTAVFLIQQTLFLFGARFCIYAAGMPVSAAALLSAVSPLAILIYPTLLVLALTPIFTTGELRASEARTFGRYLLSGWRPGGLRRGKMASGLPYLAGLMLLVFALFALSFVVTGQAGAFWTGRLPGTLPSAMGTPAMGIRLLQFAIAMFASLIGFAAIGLFFSVLTQNRWVALALSYALLLVVFIGPMMALTNYRMSGVPGGPALWINLFYLNPLTCLMDLSDTSGGVSASLPLMFGAVPIWIITTILHLFFGGIAMMLALPLVTRIAAQRVLPYEDLRSLE